MVCERLLSAIAFLDPVSNLSFLSCTEQRAKAKFSLALMLFASMVLGGCGGGSGSTQQKVFGPATHLVVTAQGTATAGVPFNITVTAMDASNNVVTNYMGVVHFTSSDAQAVLPGDQNLPAGSAALQVTLYSSGNQTITATDTTTATIKGASGAISVKVLIATHFGLGGPTTTTTGSQFNFTVTALDASNSQVGTYSGTVHFTSSDKFAALPGDLSLTNGTASLPATLTTTGSQTITATDTVTGTITGTSPAINVMGATHFSVSAPASATAGSAFSITVTALDASNAVVPAYEGTVNFTSSDSQADLPKTPTMTSGTQTFNLALKTASPNATVTITDTVTAITGRSGAINVKAAAAANPVPLIHLPLSPDAVMPGSSGFTLIVNGAGFVAGSKVYWNGSLRATTFVSKTMLKATILVADVATPNTASVTVVSPSPGGGTSNVVFFEATLPTLGVAFGTSSFSGFATPLGVATGDFNRDGKLDVVVANNNGSNVSVLLGNGDGTFQAPVNYPTGASAYAVAVADLNGDGKQDLAVANNSGSSVSILLGNGDGTFQAAVNYTVPCCASSVAVGDFNEDGKPDLVLATNGASVLLGNGDGTFQPVLNYPAGSNTAAVAVGDLNGDGHLDLAIADNGTGNVFVLLGDGDGNFQPALVNTIGSGAAAVVVGDFNGDGIPDLAVTNNGNNTLSVLIGNGDGTFQSPVNYATAGFPWGLTTADLNGDGKLDLVVSGGIVSEVFLGKGDGTFEPAVDYVPVGAYPAFVTAGDFNGQGRLDLFLPTSASDVSELAQATLVPSATFVNFPLQLLQINSATQDLTLTNVTNQAISISGIAVSGTNAAEFTETDTCTPSVAAESTCSVHITFTPAQVGPRTATITVTNSGVGNPQSVALNGTGIVSGPNATLSATSVSVSCRQRCGFPPIPCYCVCTSTPGPVTLSDYGSADLSVTGISTSSPFTETNTCSTGVASGNSCSIRIGMSASGSVAGMLTINDNAPGSPQVVTLTGNATCRPR